jgi:predicted Zn-dependent protease
MFKYLLVPVDVKDSQFRLVFSTSFGNSTTSFHAGVVSTARLETNDPSLSRRERAQVLALRKLIRKSIARVAGFPDAQRCILAFPRTRDERDRKSCEFCPQDREVLVSARILKAQESAGCAYVAQN